MSAPGPVPVPFAWIAQASTVAPRTDLIFGVLGAISVLLIFAVFGLIGVFLVRYRRGSPASRKALPIASWKIEATWTAATTGLFLIFFFWGAQDFLAEETPPPNAEVIHVVARQWMWDIHQPNGRREFDTLHVPLNQPVRLLMTSEDVIHSFYVPAFRLKQDVVPGKEVSLWFIPSKVGEFRLFCSEYCGSKHAEMTGTVVVQRPGDYERWLAESPAPGDTLASGRRLFVQYGCAGCHSPGSTVHAPMLQGLYGKRVPQDGGGFALVDEFYLRDCILEPERVSPAGYAHLMPSFRGVIPESDLLQIIAYIKEMAHGEAAGEPRRTP